MEIKTEKRIKDILSEEWELSDKKTVSKYYSAVLCLYDMIGRLEAIKEAPECLKDDIRQQYLTVNDHLGHYRTSGRPYDSEEEWLWYMDEENTSKAISLTNLEVMDEDDLSLEFVTEGIIPQFTIHMERRAKGYYYGYVSEFNDPCRPWISCLLNSCTGTRKTSRLVVSDILKHIRKVFKERYHLTIRIPRTNYDVEWHQ